MDLLRNLDSKESRVAMKRTTGSSREKKLTSSHPFSFPSSPLLSTLADLIERAQFAKNQIMYTPGGFEELKDKGFEGTWLDWFLREIETFHGKSLESSRSRSAQELVASSLPPLLTSAL